MSKDTRASRPALYKHPRKPVESKVERDKSRKSPRSYNVYGGGDDAS